MYSEADVCRISAGGAADVLDKSEASWKGIFRGDLTNSPPGVSRRGKLAWKSHYVFILLFRSTWLRMVNVPVPKPGLCHNVPLWKSSHILGNCVRAGSQSGFAGGALGLETGCS